MRIQGLEWEVPPKGSHVFHMGPQPVLSWWEVRELWGGWRTLGTYGPARRSVCKTQELNVRSPSGSCPSFLYPEPPRWEQIALWTSTATGKPTQVTIFLYHGGLQSRTVSQNKPFWPSRCQVLFLLLLLFLFSGVFFFASHWAKTNYHSDLFDIFLVFLFLGGRLGSKTYTVDTRKGLAMPLALLCFCWLDWLTHWTMVHLP